jgi:hypothetical protein
LRTVTSLSVTHVNAVTAGQPFTQTLRKVPPHYPADEMLLWVLQSCLKRGLDSTQCRQHRLQRSFIHNPPIFHLIACKNFLSHLLRQRNSAPIALGRILGQSMDVSICNQQ